MDKEIPVPKKVNKKVVNIHNKKPIEKKKQDILTPCSSEQLVLKLHEALFKQDLTCVATAYPTIIMGLRSVIKEIRHHYPNAVTGDKYPIIKTKVTEVFVIELLEKPNYVDLPNGREKWENTLTIDPEWNARRQVWESLGVKYIVDYNIDKIIAEIRSMS